MLLHALEMLLPPPSHLPHIYPVLNVLLCTPVFTFTWLWSIKRSVEVSWGIGGLRPVQETADTVHSASTRERETISIVTGNTQDLTQGASPELDIIDHSNHASSPRTRSLGSMQGKRMLLRNGSSSVRRSERSL